MKSKITNLAIVVLGVIFLFSAYRLLSIKLNEKKENEEFEDLRSKIEEMESTATEETKQPIEDPQVAQRRKYKKIYQENHDFAGWLRIPKTTIDYPVMSVPHDPNFYLRRNFQKQDSMSGTPFIGEGVDVHSKSFIIYSHNMNNGSMFGTLEKYKDIDYRDAHRIIEFNTMDGKGTYEVIAAFYIDLDQHHFDYYNYYGDWTEENFNNFIENISRISIYGSVENVHYTDQIIQLSTCSYFVNEGRFVVVAKKINNEDPL